MQPDLTEDFVTWSIALMDPYGIGSGIAYGLAMLSPGGTGDTATEAAATAVAMRSWMGHSGSHSAILSLTQSVELINSTVMAPNVTAGNATSAAEHAANPLPFPMIVAVLFFFSVIIVCVVFEILHPYLFSNEYGTELIEERTRGTPARWNIGRNLSIAIWYFQNDGKIRGRLLAGAIILFSTFNVAVSYAVNILVGRYWDAMNAKDLKAFNLALVAFCSITLVEILGGAYNGYISRMLEIHAREALTRRYWTMWMKNSAHYRGRASFENPDQRIQVDSNRYVGLVANLTLGLYSNALSLIVFLPLLWQLSPPGPWAGVVWPGWLCQVAFVYAGLGTVLVHLVGSRMINLQFGMERCEADFRSRLVTIRDESEFVAMVNAEEREQENLGGLFKYIKSVFWSISFLSKRLSFFHGAFGLIGEIGPILLLTPAYFNGTITMGGLLQVRNALRTVQGNFNWGVHAYSTIADWSMSSSRLLDLQEQCERLPEAPGAGRTEGELSAAKLTYTTPKGDTLIENSDLKVDGWTMVTGPEGSGKTTLLRVLRGLWPAEGQVKGDALYLPVTGKCAGLRRGTLHAAVTYPLPEDRFSRNAVQAALARVGLGEFSLDEEAEWGKRLSSGQFSRLQLAHVLLVQPERLVLDEPTSHCAPGEPAQLFQLLKDEVPSLKSVLTVTHQAEDLAPFHGTKYKLEGKKFVRA